MSCPRISRISPSETLVRSRPLKMTLPLTIFPGRWRRMTLRAVTDLPLPDSPTMPSVSPGLSSNETPSTALTSPSLVLKTVWRSCTSRRVSLICGGATSAGIESVSDRVPENVRGEHRHKDRDPREHHQPSRVEEIALGIGEHVAPARGRRLDAEPQEVEGRLDQDDLANPQARGHDQHGQHVRQQVAEDQAHVTR